MKKVLGGILLVVYSIIAITVTILLLSYNEYNCSEIGGYTVYIVNDDSLEPEYKQGTILLVKHTSDKNVQKGDKIFLYKVINSQEYQFINRTLDNKIQQGNHINYVVDDAESYDSGYFVGKASDTVVIEGWGYLLSVLESKWGYLFCVVIVSLLLFLQEVFDLTMEIKYGMEVKKARKASTTSNDVEGSKGASEHKEANKHKEVSEHKETETKKPSTKKTADTTHKTSTTKKASTAKTTSASKKAGTAKTTSKKSVNNEKEANSEEE